MLFLHRLAVRLCFSFKRKPHKPHEFTMKMKMCSLEHQLDYVELDVVFFCCCFKPDECVDILQRLHELLELQAITQNFYNLMKMR